jgi:hypothetical protein
LLCTLKEKTQTKSYDLETARDRETPGISFDGDATARSAKETMEPAGAAMGTTRQERGGTRKQLRHRLKRTRIKMLYVDPNSIRRLTTERSEARRREAWFPYY